MTKEEYLHKIIHDCNPSKRKQTAKASKYPQGYFHAKKCKHCGKVRGLLCHNCNRALGLFQDDPDLTQRATKYLKV